MVIVENDISRKYNTQGFELGLTSSSSITDIEKQIENFQSQIEELTQRSNITDNKDHKEIKDIKPGEKFFGTITTTIKDPNTGKKVRTKITDVFKMIENSSKSVNITVENEKGQKFKTSRKGTQLKSFIEKIQNELKKNALKDLIKKKEQEKKEYEAKVIDFSKIDTVTKIERTIKAGIKNLWLVGPAGSGKSFMTRQVADALGLPYICISCGIGTSSTEFVGYKYPNRESTKFAEYYAKPSIILLDEFTALDPAVAQICNAALANDEIETTTGTVYRDPNCIIIATSNTYGSGASRQYVANNQLDASTIDRFIGGIIEVNYSDEYESQYDYTVVRYVNTLRNIIKEYDLRKIASTRMIQAGCKLKSNFIKNWRELLISNWSDNEKKIVQTYFEEHKITEDNFLQFKVAA